ncbi:MAG: PKD domain-containing protein [Myxococcales bacterium]
MKYTPTNTSPDESTGAIVITGTDPENTTVEIPLKGRVNRAPIALVDDVGNGAPGATIQFSGKNSQDPDNHTPLQYAWKLKSYPLGSRAAPTPKDTPETSLTMDLPGQYRMELTVKDSLGCLSAPVLKDVIAKPAQQLLVEVVWNNYDADIDLHMVPDGEDFFSARDCYFAQGHRSPDWGVIGDPSDDPSLDRDDLTGFGPEIIGYPNPANGKYRVMAHYYSDHGSKNPRTEVTIRVYQFGVVKSEMRKWLDKGGQKWVALTVEWPSGTVTPIDQVQ